jgi:phage shock protein A
MARLERNQMKLNSMMEKNTVELARQSAEIRQNQRRMQSVLNNSLFSDKNLTTRIAALESGQAQMVAKIEANEQKLAKKVTGSRDAVLTNVATSRDRIIDKVRTGNEEVGTNVTRGSERVMLRLDENRAAIIQNIAASGEDVKGHVTVKSEAIGYQVAAMGEEYEEGIENAQKAARAASTEVSGMKSSFGELETRLSESFSKELAGIKENQKSLSEGIKSLQFNVNELSTEMATVKENQSKLKTEFVSENEAFRTEVIKALERLNLMISQLDKPGEMKAEPTVAAETNQEISGLAE